MLKDHLGNVRMVLTEEVKQNAYPAATIEVATITSESTFSQLLASTPPPWLCVPANQK